jgi:hypothetical protein
VRRETLTGWLREAKLMKRTQGRYSRFVLRDDLADGRRLAGAIPTVERTADRESGGG